MVKTPQDRFDEKWIGEPNSGCWLWTGTLGNGYGEIQVEKQKHVYAHRLSWELHCGPIPKGMCVLHSCDMPCCVNPDHLWLGTKGDNARDMVRKGRNPDFRGERSGNSNLTDADVIAIRAATGTHRSIAAQHGVSQSRISDIRAEKSWKHLTNAKF